MSDPRNEDGVGMVQCAPSQSWWFDVTITLRTEAVINDPAKTGKQYPVTYICAYIVLPDGVQRAFKTFPEWTPIGEIRREAGERFKEVWDPINRCER